MKFIFFPFLFILVLFFVLFLMQRQAILIIITMNFILFKYQYTTAIGGHVYVYKTCMLKKKQFVMIIQGINFDYKKY